MAVIVDACGRSCPEPVLLTKKALASKGDHYEVLVDNVTAKENVTRFAKNAGYGTKDHLSGLDNFGVTPIHRRSFEPIKSIIKSR